MDSHPTSITNCEVLGKLFSLPEPQFSYQKKGDKSQYLLLELLEDLMGINDHTVCHIRVQ